MNVQAFPLRYTQCNPPRSFISSFPLPLSSFSHQHTQTLTRTRTHTNRRKTEGPSKRKQQNREGQLLRCPSSPFSFIRVVLSFRRREGLGLSERTVRKQEAPPTTVQAAEKARWNLFAGFVLQGGGRPLLERRFCAPISFLWMRRPPLPKASLLSGHARRPSSKHQGQAAERVKVPGSTI